MPDKSNGYESVAGDFIRSRTLSIGPETVRTWAKGLPSGASVLDLGCGFGCPISQELIEGGFAVYGVDAAETLVAEFRRRFPDTAVECSSVEESLFFNRMFDAVVAWGLMFLLPEENQRRLIGKVAGVMKPGGQFLFTAPKQACTWLDRKTSLPSISLGYEAYKVLLSECDLVLTGNAEDAGGNYYYLSTRT